MSTMTAIAVVVVASALGIGAGIGAIQAYEYLKYRWWLFTTRDWRP